MSNEPILIRPRRAGTNADLLTIDEVADVLRVSRSTIYRLLAERSLGFVSIGRRKRIRREQLEAFLDSVSMEVTNA